MGFAGRRKVINSRVSPAPPTDTLILSGSTHAVIAMEKLSLVDDNKHFSAMKRAPKRCLALPLREAKKKPTAVLGMWQMTAKRRERRFCW
jgi:hypothetical protein